MFSRDTKKWLSLVGFVVAVLGYVHITTSFLMKDPSWFNNLIRPPIAPSNQFSMFGWIGSYVLLAIAAWRIWLDSSAPSSMRRLIIWAGHLTVSATWAYWVMTLESTLAGLLHALVLLVTALIVHYEFDVQDESAALFLTPYLLWLTYHTLFMAWTFVIN